MQAKNIVILIHILFVLAIIYGVSGKINMYPAVTIAIISLCFYWYKNIIIDRIMLTIYIAFMIIAACTFIPSDVINRLFDYIPPYASPASAGLLFWYFLLFIVGAYTTFCTKAGFVGVIGDNQKAIRNASLALLGVVTIVPIIVVTLGVHGEARSGFLPFLILITADRIAKSYAISHQSLTDQNL
jgi:hypothetical protein